MNMETKKILENLKEESGSHSPSVETITEIFGADFIKADFCFLSNPYATEIFRLSIDELISNKRKWYNILEFYPPQNQQIAKKISKSIEINPSNIIVGNGAVEIIQMILHNYVNENILITLPTFSPYYEYVKEGTEVHYFHLSKSDNFQFNVQEYIDYCKRNKIKNVVLINPNNPTGSYISKNEMLKICRELSYCDNIIIDESFIDFAHENWKTNEISLIDEYQNMSSNVVLIYSMSKNFGVAGLRAGFGIMQEQKVKDLLKHGYLWNISGITSYFFDLFSNKDFNDAYDQVRMKYLSETDLFYNQLRILFQESKEILVYPSNSNFVLMELLGGLSSNDFALDFLCRYGIYVRDCSDKVGLEGQFVRIASRTNQENEYFLNSISEYFGN